MSPPDTFIPAEPHVALFVTCIVDLYRPTVAFAAIRLLEDAGCRVSVPEAQTCCGQPAYNSGGRKEAAAIARQVIRTFEPFDHVVVPSGSCGGMIVHHMPRLFEDDAMWRKRAEALAGKTHELTRFLSSRGGVGPVTTDDLRVTYHDSCSSLREMGVEREPRAFLEACSGATLCEMADRAECCGFGGLFSVKYPEISEAMVTAKAASVMATEADLLVGGDLGCLLNIAGRLKRQGSGIAVRHVAEVLAGMTDAPAIGDGGA